MKKTNLQKPDILSVAKELAEWHRESDPDTSRILCYSNEQDTIIRLLEVSKEVPTSGSVFSVSYAPGNGIPYASSIILLSPRDFAKVRKGVLELPAEWGKLSDGKALLGRPLAAK